MILSNKFTGAKLDGLTRSLAHPRWRTSEAVSKHGSVRTESGPNTSVVPMSCFIRATVVLRSCWWSWLAQSIRDKEQETTISWFCHDYERSGTSAKIIGTVWPGLQETSTRTWMWDYVIMLFWPYLAVMIQQMALNWAIHRGIKRMKQLT